MNQDNRFTTTDVTLAYTDTGVPPVPEAETLVFIHGAGANMNQFEPQLEYFARTYRVIAPSLRGHGQSTCPTDHGREAFRLDLMARDIIELITHLNVAPVHIVGNSAGGVMGLEIARQKPEIVRSLAIYGTPGKMSFPAFLKKFTLWFDTRNATKNPEKTYKTLAKYTSKMPHTREQVYQMFLEATQAIPGFRYSLGSYDYLPVIRTLPCPFCILKGQYDRDINMVLKKSIRAMEEQKAHTGLPSRLIDLPGVGHIANLDDPQVFNTALQQWLESSMSSAFSEQTAS